MSYDLYFYKTKASTKTTSEIAEYLSDNLVDPNETGTQWAYENQDTGVYYSIDFNDPAAADADSEEPVFNDFENTGFSLNVNYARPNFFGWEAFQFVDEFISEMDLYALNPQSDSDPDQPTKPEAEELYENWVEQNEKTSRYFIKEHNAFHFCDEVKSNDAWTYNFSRVTIQEELGEEYFVPKIFFVTRAGRPDVLTLTTWTEHIPCVLPVTDLYMLNREKKKLFRTVKEDGAVSRETLMQNFGQFFAEYDFQECVIVHPHQAEAAAGAYNSVKFEVLLDEISGIPVEEITNAEVE